VCVESQIGVELLAMFSGNGRRLVTVIQAFLDESGTNPEMPVLSVAGSYGKEDQWIGFRQLWEPHARGFHAKNCSHLFGAMVDAIATTRIPSMLVTVSKKTYKEYASAHFKTALGNDYAACALLCTVEICKEVHPLYSSFVLEAGQPNVGFIKEILEYIMEHGAPEQLIAAVASAQKEQFIELQCADFVSHIASSYDKPWMKKLFDLGLLKHLHVTRDHLEKSAPQVTNLIRELRVIRKKIKNSK
jgi:hypothetical protein